MVNGQWSMVNGQWSMFNGQLSMVNKGNFALIDGIVYLQSIFSFTIHHFTKKSPDKINCGALNLLNKDYSSIFTFPLLFAITSSAILFGAGE